MDEEGREAGGAGSVFRRRVLYAGRGGVEKGFSVYF